MPNYIYTDEFSYSSSLILLGSITLSNCIVDIGRKMLIDRGSPLTVVTIRAILQSLLLYTWVVFIEGIDLNFYGWITNSYNWINAFVVFACSICHLSAIKSSQLEVTLPYLNHCTSWVTVIGYVFYNENLGIVPAIGLSITIIGHVLLNLSQYSKQPSKYTILNTLIPQDNGARLMMISAFLWGLTVSLETPGLASHHPLIHICLTQILISVYGIGLWHSSSYSNNFIDESIVNILEPTLPDGLHDIRLHEEKIGVKSIESPLIKLNTPTVFLITSLMAMGSYSLFSLALQFEYNGYVSASKRFSIIFSLLVDKYILKTKKTGGKVDVWALRFCSCMLMCTGSILLMM